MAEPASLRRVPVLATTASFEQFFGAEYRRLCEALLLLTGDQLEADDVAHEAMTRVLERWDRVASVESPIGYLFRTAMNVHRNRLRSLAARTRRSFLETPGPDPGATVGEQQDVRRALAKLSARERQALILTDWLEMDAAEVGDVLGVKPNAVRVRLHRARTNLRRQLGDDDD
jgi:RNA polymerase sigma-70 factor (ECF subfamily)